MRARTVDVHVHVVPPGIFGKAGPRWGPEIVDRPDARILRVGGYQVTIPLKVASADEDGRDGPREAGAIETPGTPGPAGHLERMDRAGWDVHVVSPMVHFFLYHAEPEIGVPFSALHNDLLAEFCSADPDRLFFQATLPLQDVDAAAREIDRVVAMGARGIYTGATNLAGREMDDEAFNPIWQKMVDHELPLMIHAQPEVVPEGLEDRYSIAAFVGAVAEETKAFCYLVFGGVLDRYPGLKVYISHGGGFVPYQLGRMEVGGRVMQDGRNKRSVRDYLPSFYFDLLLLDRPARRALLDTVPVENLLSGDNFGGADAVDAIAVLEGLELSAAEKERILCGNASALYKLPAG